MVPGIGGERVRLRCAKMNDGEPTAMPCRWLCPSTVILRLFLCFTCPAITVGTVISLVLARPTTTAKSP